MKRLCRILITLVTINLLCWALPKILRRIVPSAPAQQTAAHPAADIGTTLIAPAERIQRIAIPFELSFMSPEDGSFAPHIHDVSPPALILWHILGLSLLYDMRRRKKYKSLTA